MKTTVTKEYLETPIGQQANKILRNCVHCGFCNATCPTYQLTGDELDGPRGRIYLIKEMLEGNTPGEHTLNHLDRCLTCRNCETTCPSGVNYSRLLDTGRKLVAQQVKRALPQRIIRLLLRKLFLNQFIFKFTLRCGQISKLILPHALGKTIPGYVKKNLAWPNNIHNRKIILAKGCVQNSLQPNIDTAAALVFDKHNIQCLSVSASGCCGAISHHLDAEDEALGYIKRNIDAWWPLINSGQVEAISMTASGCGVMIKDYAGLLEYDADYSAKAAKISALYKDPCELFGELFGELFTDEMNNAPKQQNLRVAFHPPCTLQHGLKLNGRIEHILKSQGYQLVEFENPHLCCGSAGTYSITQRSLSQALLSNKLEAIHAVEPDVIVTANIGCQTHLQSNTDIPVKHWLELLV